MQDSGIHHFEYIKSHDYYVTTAKMNEGRWHSKTFLSFSFMKGGILFKREW